MSEKSVRITNNEASRYVQTLALFHNNGTNHRHPKGSTLWSERRDDLYVVYSYGAHFPLYINWKGVWFGNSDKSSRTTNRHKGQASPRTAYVPLESRSMLDFVYLRRSPSPEILDEAARLKLLPDELIPLAVQARIAG